MSDLPLGWTKTTLGEIREDAGVGINPARFAHEEFELYSVPSHALGSPEIVLGTSIGSNKQTVAKDTVLLCKINPRINRVWVVEPKTSLRTIASTEWIAFSSHAAVRPHYLAYYMRQSEFRDYLAQHASGVGGSLMRVKPSTFSKFPFLLAPQGEQDRIVGEIDKQFTRLDAATAALKRVQVNLKRYRASVLKAACEGRLVPSEAELARKEGRDYEPADKLLQRIQRERRARWEANTLAKMVAAGKPPSDDRWKQTYKEPATPDTTLLPPLPEGWCWVRAEQVCEFITKGTTPSANELKKDRHGIPFVKVYNLTFDGSLDFSVNPTFISREVHEGVLARSKVYPGDILMNIVGPPLGKISLVPTTHEEWNTNQAVAIFRPIQGLDTLYLMQLLMTTSILDWAVRRSKATAGQFNLTLEICRDLPLPLPPIAEQRRLATTTERAMSVFDRTMSVSQTQQRRSDSMRRSILSAAFSGKLVSQHESDESATVLLERIRNEKISAASQKSSRRALLEVAHV